MWVMTSFGILMPAIRPPKTVDLGDERTLQVRTRREKDLDILRARYMPRTLGATIATPKMDYEFRAYCTPEAWALAIAAMSLDLIDYTKFKPSTEDKFGDQELHHCYDALWSVVMRHLGTPRYWGSAKGTNGYVGGSYFGPAHDWGTFSDVQYPALPGGDGWGKHRNTAADRDTYVYDPATDGDPWDYTPEDARIDTLYVEMDRLLDQQEGNLHIDHSTCTHGPGPAAKARCRRRRRAENRARIEEIRTILDESYAEVTEHLGAETAMTGQIVE